MKIVVDTNVLISGVFFGGFPQEVLRAVIGGKVTACASTEIIDEYTEIMREMIARKQGKFNAEILTSLISHMEIIETVSCVEASRDPDDDKFIECALDAKALYIVSGDNDLLVLKEYGGVRIVTAKAFCDEYLD